MYAITVNEAGGLHLVWEKLKAKLENENEDGLCCQSLHRFHFHAVIFHLFI